MNKDQKQSLEKQIKSLDLAGVRKALQASLALDEEIRVSGSASGSFPQPVPSTLVAALASTTVDERLRWRSTGLKLVAEGKIAVVLLAGGQGTRLGSPLPKGCFSIDLPSAKSLFQLHAERLDKLQRLAADAVYGRGSIPEHRLLWFIMTSPATHARTVDFFEECDYFGLDEKQVVFFQQGSLPCLTEEGKLILESEGRIAMAPDGNGGLYAALASSGALDKMKTHGVQAVDVLCVDNALARVAHPEWLGYCWERQAEVGARVVARKDPNEKVGVFVLTTQPDAATATTATIIDPDGTPSTAEEMGADGDTGVAPAAAPAAPTPTSSATASLIVQEYSELGPELACATDAKTGKLMFPYGNLCMHYFSLGFLERTAASLRGDGAVYHVARKKIPSVGSAVEGIKLEQFIFDPFPTSDKTVLFEIAREEDFAPVKNASGSASDSPESARMALLELHRKWIEAAGGNVTTTGVAVGREDPISAAVHGIFGTAIGAGNKSQRQGVHGVEVSPAVSYEGEGLEWTRGRVFKDQSEITALSVLNNEKTLGKSIATLMSLPKSRGPSKQGSMAQSRASMVMDVNNNNNNNNNNNFLNTSATANTGVGGGTGASPIKGGAAAPPANSTAAASMNGHATTVDSTSTPSSSFSSPNGNIAKPVSEE